MRLGTFKPCLCFASTHPGRAIFDFGFSGFAGCPDYHAPLRWPWLKPGVKS